MDFYFSPENIKNFKEIVSLEQCRVEAISAFNDEYTTLDLIGTSGWDNYRTIIKNSSFKEFCNSENLLGCMFPVITNIGGDIRHKPEGINAIILIPFDKKTKFLTQPKIEGKEPLKFSDFSNTFHVCSEFIDEFYAVKNSEILKFKFLNYEFNKFKDLDYLELKLADDKEEKILRILIDNYNVFTFPGLLNISNNNELISISSQLRKLMAELLISKSKISFFTEKEKGPEYKKNKRNHWDEDEYWQTSLGKELEPKVVQWIKENESFVFDFREKYTFKDLDAIDFDDKYLHSFLTKEEKEEKKKSLIDNEDYEGLKKFKDKN